MAPTRPTEDYYAVLEVQQKVTTEVIVRAYKRLALIFHPDRNRREDATERFQLIVKAYDTLKDLGLRRSYDAIYHTIKHSQPQPHTSSSFTSSTQPQPSSTSSSTASASEKAEIAHLLTLKQQRQASFLHRKNIYESAIFEEQREIRKIEQEISNLENIFKAEAASEASKNSWTTWLLSPFQIKPREESEVEKERKGRERNERRLDRDMKERRLDVKKQELKLEEERLKSLKEEIERKDEVDDRKMKALREKIAARETREREARGRVERERLAKIWKQQQEEMEKRRREQAELLRKKQEDLRAAAEQQRRAEAALAQKRREEEHARIWEGWLKVHSVGGGSYGNVNRGERGRRPNGTSSSSAASRGCIHDGWWPKVQGRATYPECLDVWDLSLGMSWL